MKLRLLVPRATLRGAQAIGDVIDVAPEEARRMVAAGQAEQVRGRKTEHAVPRDVAEKATG